MIDIISPLLRRVQLTPTLDKRCLLGRTTQMDVAQHGELEAPFHVLLEGECELHVGDTTLAMSAGDVVMIPSGAAHRIVTPGPGVVHGTSETSGEAFAMTRSDTHTAAVVDLFCGHCSFDAGAGKMLFDSLPGIVHTAFGRSRESDEMLHMVSVLMRNEAQRDGAGSDAILSALCTVLMTMVLRTSRGDATTATLWTAAGEGRVAQAVRDVLDDPGEDWTIARLSESAAMSRATFIRHFERETGTSVGAFVARARLMKAAELLASTDIAVSSVSRQVGYRSESAFTRAFRAAVGTTPARFRRHE